MAIKGGLGRGFDSLFAENAADTESGIEVRLAEIEPNRDQPRKEFDQTALEELSESIKRHGLIQPLLVRPNLNGGYQLVAGERRWRACRMAGLEEVPVVIKELTDRETMEIAMIENLQREDLNPIEEAAGYKYLMDNYSLTQQEIADGCSKSRSAVANAIRLLSLPENVIELIKNGTLTSGHGRAILAIEDEQMRELAINLAINGATVRELEKLATKKRTTPKKPTIKDTYYREIELAMKDEIGRKVKILEGNKKNSGTITLEFFSKEDLTEIVKILTKMGGKPAK